MDEQRLSGKKATSVETETVLFQKWIKPAIGNLPLAAIGKADLDAIRTTMLNKGMAIRSFLYVLAIISQVFNLCIGKETYSGTNPVSIYKKARRKQLTFDNKKQRFLNDAEAAELMNTIKARSLTLYHVCMVSLYAGLRASEIFRLRWADVDLVNGFLFIKETKAGPSRNVPLHEKLIAIFREIVPSDKTALVFTGKNGKPLSEVSRTFDRCVDELKLNEGIDDRRQKLTFHNLRHSCASWLVMQGVDLYTVGKLLGHTTSRMTEKYSHLSEEHMKQAIGKIGRKRDMDKVIPFQPAENQ